MESYFGDLIDDSTYSNLVSFSKNVDGLLGYKFSTKENCT